MTPFTATSPRTVLNNTGTNYTHLECPSCKTQYDKHFVHTWCNQNNCGQPLLVKYSLRGTHDKSLLRTGPTNMWRYKEMLPIEQEKNIVSLGEGMTPLLLAHNLGNALGLEEMWIKDESANPTGSFKARGLGMAISKAKELGIETCVIPTAGNAGGAMSAYCAKAGMKAYVYMPKDTPKAFKVECLYFGAHVKEISGNISDCAKQIREDWKGKPHFDISTLKEPFRIEGKKTMGYEIAEQMGWNLPDVIVYPTGGGTGLIGIWKAFSEMEQLGWIGNKRPRMVAVQAEGCCPIVEAFQRGHHFAKFFTHAKTFANGLRVPAAFGDRLILSALRESKGTAVAVSDKEILKAVVDISQKEGLLVAPEGAATWAATQKLVQEGWIRKEEKVVLLNTGSGYKYIDHYV